MFPPKIYFLITFSARAGQKRSYLSINDIKLDRLPNLIITETEKICNDFVEVFCKNFRFLRKMREFFRSVQFFVRFVMIFSEIERGTS